MPRETVVTRHDRTQKIISALKRTYPDAHCELNFSNPLQLLVATILSAQCTDKRVNIVTAELFKKYRSAKDFAEAPLADIEAAVKTTGFFRNKAKNIKACCAALVDKFGGEVPRTMDELHALAGVGRKTANVVLGNAFNINVGVVVDTHVTRLSNRLGLVKGTDAVKLEQELCKLMPQNEWTLFSHLLIWHGRRRCMARSPDCEQCEIKSLCPQVGVGNDYESTKFQPPTSRETPNIKDQSPGGLLELGAWCFPRCRLPLPWHTAFDMNWLFLNSGKHAAPSNMAWDEALLEAMPRLRAPALRFYGWTQPAATFGYFQKHAEVAAATHLRPLIRRPTGGGIVPHDADWTYSAIFPPGHEWHSLKAEESYRRIHDWLRLAFAEMKVATELAPCCQKSLPGQCFVGHEKSDLLWHGKKIAGAAQRRNQLGLLIQGSIQPPPVALAREAFEPAMRQVAETHFGVKWTEFSPDPELQRRAEALSADKYLLTAYNEKR